MPDSMCTGLKILRLWISPCVPIIWEQYVVFHEDLFPWKLNKIQNTYSSALLCGEKGADLLAEDLGNFSSECDLIMILNVMANQV